jgi:hypothetical protein
MLSARINLSAYFTLLAVNMVALAVIHLLWPGLRFESGTLNYVLFIVLHLSLPLLLVILARTFQNKSLKISSLVLAAVVALPTCALSYAAIGQLSAALHSEIDPSLQPISELMRGDFRYRLYRTNFNPYKAHGLLLRKERKLIPGIKFVSDIKGFYGATDGELHALAGDKALVITKPFSPQFNVEIFEFNLWHNPSIKRDA